MPRHPPARRAAGRHPVVACTGARTAARLDVPARIRARGRETVAQARRTARDVRGVAEKAPAVDGALRDRPSLVAAIVAAVALLVGYRLARTSASRG
ncbi:hypothetical protein [Pseudonocardia acidicola]|uniref:DUF3618 domain-containing protein n=1 Tax=Pseudonocardia acidicola TaxID=2724939 RepID=A0ABX1S488_9PSEU|nr:hypothetical protein [Pseudonocardia acidicola]NMH96385.1 hypothetical protein [Pseudonocardia acidicola]